MSSVENLHPDIMNHIILPLLPLSSLSACSLTSRAMKRSIASYCVLRDLDVRRKQFAILEDIFASGYGDLLTWYEIRLQFRVYQQKSFMLLNLAAKAGHLDLLKRFPPVVIEGYLRAGRLAELAAIHGHIRILEWILSFGDVYRVDHASVTATAAQSRQLATLKWLHARGIALNIRCFIWAARNKDFAMLRWLRDARCPWGAEVCAWAARTDLQVLQWLRTNGCQWDVRVSLMAAANGRLDCLKWARENGCAWDEQVIPAAIEADHTAIVEWARENGCPE